MAQGFLLNNRRVDKAFRMTCNISGDNRLGIGISYIDWQTVNFTVDWGDGTSNHYDYDNYGDWGFNASHTYVNSGNYKIAVSGICIVTGIYPEETLTEINNWGSPSVSFVWSSGDMAIPFRDCVNLEKIPNSPLMGAETATNIINLFANCKKLKKIPSYFFTKCKAVTEIRYVVEDGNLEEIGDGLFQGLENLTDVSRCFYGNEKLSAIGKDIFKGCTNLSILFQFLYKCGVKNVPQGIFDDLTNATDFAYIFSHNPIETVPENLFTNNVNVTDYHDIFYNTTGEWKLPENMFNYAALANKQPDMSSAFSSYVPSKPVTKTGVAYPLWEYITLSRSNGCYNQCFDLDNYSEIPDDWK